MKERHVEQQSGTQWKEMEEEGRLVGEEKKVRAREPVTRTPLQPRYRPSVCLFMSDCENRGTTASVLTTADC